MEAFKLQENNLNEVPKLDRESNKALIAVMSVLFLISTIPILCQRVIGIHHSMSKLSAYMNMSKWFIAYHPVTSIFWLLAMAGGFYLAWKSLRRVPLASNMASAFLPIGLFVGSFAAIFVCDLVVVGIASEVVSSSYNRWNAPMYSALPLFIAISMCVGSVKSIKSIAISLGVVLTATLVVEFANVVFFKTNGLLKLKDPNHAYYMLFGFLIPAFTLAYLHVTKANEDQLTRVK